MIWVTLYIFYVSLANQMLEQLYQREIVEKPIERQNLRLEVAQLMEKMYEEQQSKITKRESEKIHESLSEPNHCQESFNLKQKSTMVGLAFMKLWVKYHENEINDAELEIEVCSIVKKAKSWGKSVHLVANMIKNHLEFLLDTKIIDCKS